MSKILTFGFSILITLSSVSQEFDFKEPENLRMKITTMDSFYNDSIQLGDTIGISLYDSRGNKTKSIHKSNSQISSNSLYHFDKQNRLIEYIDYGRQYYQTFTDPITRKEKEISKYDSTITMQIKKYKYENNKLKQLDWYEFGTNLIISEIYDYDNSGRLIKELTIDYPSPNTLVYFKPNSTEIDWNHPRQENISVSIKTYKYKDNLRLGEYYDSTKLMGLDTTVFENELIKRTVKYVINGEKIFEAFYKYNESKQLTEYRTDDSGQSVYGGWYDMLSSNRVLYKYDSNEYLIAKEDYFNDELLTKYHYNYSKK